LTGPRQRPDDRFPGSGYRVGGLARQIVTAAPSSPDRCGIGAVRSSRPVCAPAVTAS